MKEHFYWILEKMSFAENADEETDTKQTKFNKMEEDYEERNSDYHRRLQRKKSGNDSKNKQRKQ